MGQGQDSKFGFYSRRIAIMTFARIVKTFSCVRDLERMNGTIVIFIAPPLDHGEIRRIHMMYEEFGISQYRDLEVIQKNEPHDAT